MYIYICINFPLLSIVYCLLPFAYCVLFLLPYLTVVVELGNVNRFRGALQPQASGHKLIHIGSRQEATNSYSIMTNNSCNMK